MTLDLTSTSRLTDSGLRTSPIDHKYRPCSSLKFAGEGPNKKLLLTSGPKTSTVVDASCGARFRAPVRLLTTYWCGPGTWSVSSARVTS